MPLFHRNALHCVMALSMFGGPLSGMAQPPSLEQRDKLMMGSCAALGVKIVQNSQQFSPEFRQLGRSLMFMPAVVEPPLKDDPDFINGRDSMADKLASTSPSEKNPAYLQAMKQCISWSNDFTARQPGRPD